MTQFSDAVDQFIQSRGWTQSITSMIREWAQFVEIVEDCYELEIEEYFNDVSVRTRLEQVVSDPRLNAFHEMESLKFNVAQIDDRLKAVVVLSPKITAAHDYWWLKSVPRFGGERFAKDVRELFNILIDVRC